jgi:hypothetical protein
MLKNQKKMKYLVASNSMYYLKTLPIIVKSLHDCGIENNEIIIVISKCDKIIQYQNIETYCVSYNAYEYSALIHLSEIEYRDSEYVFLLHDTMSCGNNFKNLSQRVESGHKVILAHEKRWTNMGAYQANHLIYIKEKLREIKFINKLEGIKIEGHFFNCDPSFYPNATSFNITRKMDVYGTGIYRIVDYYKSVDVTKYGANGPEQLKNNAFIDKP